MHKLSLQWFVSKREALERIFEKAKVFYMTVDGFVQAASGKSSLSTYIARVEYLLANVDEAHQLFFDQLAPVSARVKKLNILCVSRRLTSPGCMLGHFFFRLFWFFICIMAQLV